MTTEQQIALINAYIDSPRDVMFSSESRLREVIAALLEKDAMQDTIAANSREWNQLYQKTKRKLDAAIDTLASMEAENRQLRERITAETEARASLKALLDDMAAENARLWQSWQTKDNLLTSYILDAQRHRQILADIHSMTEADKVF